MIFKEKQKSQPIGRRQVMDAYKKVRSNGGAAGVDKLSIKAVNAELRKYLYPVWNRLASGSYYPMPVREVEIPKADGRKRKLGIPTVQDRTAQMVIREELEPLVDHHFSKSSFGYRPKRSAHGAVKQCKRNCLKMDWVLDLDIKGFFDEIDHEMMLASLRKFTTKRHIHLYVERWLKCEVKRKDQTIHKRDKGTPQGGVISPLLANIFLHFVFDMWIEQFLPEIKFERYADDIIIHCHTHGQAKVVQEMVIARFKRCKLQIKEGKNKIVYCKRSQSRHPSFTPEATSFTFLGFTFRSCWIRAGRGNFYLSFTPHISKASQRRMVHEIRKLKLEKMLHIPLPEVAGIIASKLRGWIHYYGKINKSSLSWVFRTLNLRLAKWVRNKYRKYRRKQWYFPYKWLVETARFYPNMFEHWKHGYTP